MRVFASGIMAAILGLGWAVSGFSVSSTARSVYAQVPSHRSEVIDAFTVANRECIRKLFGDVPAIIEAATGNVFVDTLRLPAAQRGQVPSSAEVASLRQRQLPQLEDRIRAAYGSFSKEQIAATTNMLKDSGNAEKLGKCVIKGAYENLMDQGVIDAKNT